MTSFRAYWMDGDDADLTPERAELRVVSRSAPSRPRWGILYGLLGVIGANGLVAHVSVHEPVVVTVVDAVFSGLLFLVLVGWVHANRIALSRIDEPDAGVGRPQITIVRSHRNGTHAADRITRLDPDDRIILPYDFR